MKLDTRSRAAIAAILDIAVHGTNKPVAIAAISERQRVSVSYLENLFQKLRRNGFVASHRGPGGGYRLSRALSGISVADIVGAVDNELADGNPCNGIDRCHNPRSCMTSGLWCRVNGQLRDYLRSITLESLLTDCRNEAESSGALSAPTPMSCSGMAVPRHEKQPAATVA